MAETLAELVGILLTTPGASAAPDRPESELSQLVNLYSQPFAARARVNVEVHGSWGALPVIAYDPIGSGIIGIPNSMSLF